MEKKLAVPEKMTLEEKRRRNHLKRVRKVQRIKRRIMIGSSGAVILILGIVALTLNGRKEETAMGKSAVKWEEETDSEAKVDYQRISSYSDTQGEYIRILENLAETDERYQKILDRQNEYPENVLRMCAANEETLDFVVDYPDKKNFAPASTVGEVTKGQVPLLIQWDSRWGYAPYGDSTIVAVSGCGPTCIAMVACALTGRNDITPAEVADYSANNGFLTSTRDTTWDLMTYGGQEYGITGYELGLDEVAMANRLAEGSPIIVSVGPGDFTTGGHFIVITGYDGEAFSVNDPNSRIRSSQTWTFERLKGQIKNMWYYTLTD